MTSKSTRAMWVHVQVYIIITRFPMPFLQWIHQFSQLMRCRHPIYLYCYDPLQVINFYSLNMQVCYIILCHIIFLHWKIFLKIQTACHITLCHVIFLHWKIILKIQVACQITFLYWKIILKIQENHFMPHHISLLKNNSKILRSMPHHLMAHHIPLLKNNSKKLRKSHHPTSYFCIEK
jgi:hypothetical protein